jgi:hypothetical protein
MGVPKKFIIVMVVGRSVILVRRYAVDVHEMVTIKNV